MHGYQLGKTKIHNNQPFKLFIKHLFLKESINMINFKLKRALDDELIFK